jgi:hypothetical protein
LQIFHPPPAQLQIPWLAYLVLLRSSWNLRLLLVRWRLSRLLRSDDIHGHVSYGLPSYCWYVCAVLWPLMFA